MSWLRLIAILCMLNSMGLVAYAEQSGSIKTKLFTEEKTEVRIEEKTIYVAADTSDEVDREMWDMIKTSSDIEDFEIYLKEFPNGRFKKLAEFKIRKLKKSKKQEMLAKTAKVVIDNSTGFMWQRDESGAKTWRNAKKYCERLDLDGFSDWRLPNKSELVTSFNNRDRFPGFVSSSEDYYWSSSSNIKYPGLAYGMFSHDGRLFDDGDKNQAYRVRCIRGGQKRKAGDNFNLSGSWEYTGVVMVKCVYMNDRTDNRIVEIFQEGSIVTIDNNNEIYTGEISGNAISFPKSTHRPYSFDSFNLMVGSDKNTLSGKVNWTTQGVLTSDCDGYTNTTYKRE